MRIFLILSATTWDVCEWQRHAAHNTKIHNEKNHKNRVFVPTSFYRFFLLCIEDRNYLRQELTRPRWRVNLWRMMGEWTHFATMLQNGSHDSWWKQVQSTQFEPYEWWANANKSLTIRHKKLNTQTGVLFLLTFDFYMIRLTGKGCLWNVIKS